ncbi:MAG: AbrB/MazE/SpoVT family DNA-binding domain-containing protein [Chloroflexi bacterium]|nr:AbrB/MazE/SpoVT family DNA-binding domain-containing protein [Chloroflexota bacterium]
MRQGSVSPKGQVTIPLEYRRRLGLKPRDTVEFELEQGSVRVKPAPSRLKQIARSIPPLPQPYTDQEMTEIAAEEHARHVAREGLD